MQGPQRKKSRGGASLDDIVGFRGLSRSALQRVVQSLAPGTTDWAVKEAHMRRFETVRCEIELPAGDSSLTWHLAHPCKALELLVSESDELQRWFAAALKKKPCSHARPWSLLLGWDEFVPGNKLNPQPARKTMCLSFSFEELSPYLHFDAAWVTPVAVRATLIKGVDGGWSCMMREFLKLILLGPLGLATAGLPLRIMGEVRLIHATVGALLSDGDGLRQALQWTGAAGVKPCFRHPNVLSNKGNRDWPGYVHLHCSDTSKFELWTAAGLHAMADDLVAKRAAYDAGRTTWAALERAHRAAGYQVTKDGLLACAVLRRHVDVTRVVKFDWVHTMLDSGALAFAAWNLVEKCESLGLASQAGLKRFLELEWHVPRSARYGSRDVRRLPALFNEAGARGNRSSGQIRCSASELLALYGLLQHWVGTHVPPDPRLTYDRACYDKICAAIDLMLQVKRQFVAGSDASADVTDLLEEHLALYRHCYGEEAVKPKHHWAFDVAEQLADVDTHLMDAFVVERLHLRARSVADHVANTATYEQAVCAGILNTHSLAVRSRGTQEGLVGPSVESEVGALQRPRVADALRVAGRFLEVGSMVTLSRSPSAPIGHTLACVEAGGLFYVVVDEADDVRARQDKAAFCRLADRAAIWLAADVEQCLAWRLADDGVYIVIRP